MAAFLNLLGALLWLWRLWKLRPVCCVSTVFIPRRFPQKCVCGGTFPSIPVAQVGCARLCPAPTSRQCLCPETRWTQEPAWEHTLTSSCVANLLTTNKPIKWKKKSFPQGKGKMLWTQHLDYNLRKFMYPQNPSLSQIPLLEPSTPGQETLGF